MTNLEAISAMVAAGHPTGRVCDRLLMLAASAQASHIHALQGERAWQRDQVERNIAQVVASFQVDPWNELEHKGAAQRVEPTEWR